MAYRSNVMICTCTNCISNGALKIKDALENELKDQDLDNDISQADIPTAAIISERTLTGQSWVNGIMDADDIVFPSLTSTQDVGAIAIVKHNTILAQSYLIYFDDSAPEYPVTPDGSDLTITWSSGADKIFKL